MYDKLILKLTNALAYYMELYHIELYNCKGPIKIGTDTDHYLSFLF
jgi:hypothetical protein